MPTKKTTATKKADDKPVKKTELTPEEAAEAKKNPDVTAQEASDQNTAIREKMLARSRKGT